MTGLSDTQNIVDAFDAGVVDYVIKPIRTEELVVRMRTHLRNSKLTVSAYSAMDSVGQTLCVFSKEGQLRWATPNAWQLMKNFSDTGYEPNKNSKPDHRLAEQYGRFKNTLRSFIARHRSEILSFTPDR